MAPLICNPDVPALCVSVMPKVVVESSAAVMQCTPQPQLQLRCRAWIRSAQPVAMDSKLAKMSLRKQPGPVNDPGPRSFLERTKPLPLSCCRILLLVDGHKHPD